MLHLLELEYVGLVSGTAISDFGHKVICYDISEKRLAHLNNGEYSNI